MGTTLIGDSYKIIFDARKPICYIYYVTCEIDSEQIQLLRSPMYKRMSHNTFSPRIEPRNTLFILRTYVYNVANYTSFK